MEKTALYKVVADYMQELNEFHPYYAANVELIVNLCNYLNAQDEQEHYKIKNVHIYTQAEWEEIWEIYEEAEGYFETDKKRVIFGQGFGEFFTIAEKAIC